MIKCSHAAELRSTGEYLYKDRCKWKMKISKTLSGSREGKCRFTVIRTVCAVRETFELN